MNYRSEARAPGEAKHQERAPSEAGVPADDDVVGVTVIDNGGILRMKGVPGRKWSETQGAGVGMSPSVALFGASGHIAKREGVSNAIGDLRLRADVTSLRKLPSTPGWWWVPADLTDQDGESFLGCPRGFLHRMISEAKALDIELQMAFELEWNVGHYDSESNQWVPAHHGPGFGFDVPSSILQMLRGIANDLAAVDCTPGAVHAEWSDGQLETALPPRDPLRAADDALLARQIIKRRAELEGFQASFAAMSHLDQLGNGAHAHFSLHSKNGSHMAEGPGAYGLHRVTEHFIAGVLEHLPAMTALGSPTPLSFVRLQPWSWSGSYACWGVENRSAALRIEGLNGPNPGKTANVEWKAVDASANPYHVLGALIAAGLDGVRRSLKLPPEVIDDPETFTQEDRDRADICRLPSTLTDAVDRLEADYVLRDSMGVDLHESIVAVRRVDAEAVKDLDPAGLLEFFRSRH
jgi:glutamine synthetase